jgi:hypothetical protein
MCGSKYTTFNVVNVLDGEEEHPDISYRCYHKAIFSDDSCKSFDVSHVSVENAFLELLPENIVANIRQSWRDLEDFEKTIFFQRFIKKIIITANSSVVKIKSIEFNTDERPASELQTGELSNRGSVRKILRER